MCYQNCIKYECPSCGEEPIADQRSYVLCLRNSGCRWLYSRPETLPRHVTFEPGPLCGSCRETREQQRHIARNTAQNSGRPQPNSHQQRQSYSHVQQHSHTDQRQQSHTYQRPRSYTRQRAQSYGLFSARDTTADPRYEDFPFRQDHYLTRRPGERQPEPGWTEDPYLPEPQDDDVDYENYYRDHAAQPRRYSPQRAYRTHPSPPPPLRRRYTTSSHRPAAPSRLHDYEIRYRAPSNRSETIPAPSHGYVDRDKFDDTSPGASFGGDDFREYRNEYWTRDVRPRRYE